MPSSLYALHTYTPHIPQHTMYIYTLHTHLHHRYLYTPCTYTIHTTYIYTPHIPIHNMYTNHTYTHHTPHTYSCQVQNLHESTTLNFTALLWLLPNWKQIVFSPHPTQLFLGQSSSKCGSTHGDSVFLFSVNSHSTPLPRCSPRLYPFISS